KFRWPLHVRNVRRRTFYQPSSEIAEDHDVTLEAMSASRRKIAACLAAVPQPIVETTMASVAAVSSKKAAVAPTEHSPATISAPTLEVLTRLSQRFADRLTDALLTENASALQGKEHTFSQQCWTPLPMSRKPCANWQLVLELVRQRHNFDELCPPLRQSTLVRIRDRLQKLFSLPWDNDDDDNAVFQLPDEAVGIANAVDEGDASFVTL
ncbi:TPA: hypothetical protein N0F65_007226, partial [Lagenidium giganteum]